MEVQKILVIRSGIYVTRNWEQWTRTHKGLAVYLCSLCWRAFEGICPLRQMGVVN